jgi:hypothetical protein
MIYINPDDKKIKDASNKHFKKLNSFIKTRRDACANQGIIDFLTDKNIEIILKGSPKKIFQINRLFFRNINAAFRDRHLEEYFKLKRKRRVLLPAEQTIVTNYNLIFSQLKEIFDYENYFSKKDSDYSTYDLAKNLDINTCVYCNRMYTKTVIKPRKITRPEFDHWFPKSKYPLLALSFYNLIPSCHICNSSVKGSTDFTLEKYFHPYIDNEKDINKAIKFTYYNKKLDKYGFKMKFKGEKGKNTGLAFKIKEIYKAHEDEIADLRRIRDIYSESYLQNLSKIYKGIISEEEIYRLAFGVYQEEAKFHERPLSKMKRDILIELGIIKNDSK